MKQEQRGRPDSLGAALDLMPATTEFSERSVDCSFFGTKLSLLLQTKPLLVYRAHKRGQRTNSFGAG